MLDSAAVLGVALGLQLFGTDRLRPAVVTKAKFETEPQQPLRLTSRGPFEQRGDFRAFHCGTEFYIIGDHEIPRPDCLDDYRAHGYTDAWVTVTRDRGLPGVGPFDYLGDVERFRATVNSETMTAIRADGSRPSF